MMCSGLYNDRISALKVCDDILQNMDKKKVSAIALRDISAAFDTVNHSIFLYRLAKEFRVEHTICLERHQTFRQDPKE